MLPSQILLEIVVGMFAKAGFPFEGFMGKDLFLNSFLAAVGKNSVLC